jgi:hypothetical protein
MVTSLFIPNSGNAMDMIKKDIFRPLPNSNRNNINLGVSETAIEEYEQETIIFFKNLIFPFHKGQIYILIP